MMNLKFARVVAVLATFIGVSFVGLSAAQAGSDDPGEGSKAEFTASEAELLYQAIPACRIVDTRVSNAKMNPNETRNFSVDGTTAITNQGGKTGGCAIPSDADSISAVVHAIGTGAAGDFRVFPRGATQPLAASMAWGGAGITASNGFNVELGEGLLPTPFFADLTVFNEGSGSTHLAIDVTGYYVQPIAVHLNSAGAIFSGTDRVASTEKLAGNGAYRVTFDSSIAGCIATATAVENGGGQMATINDPSGSTLDVFVTNDDGVLADSAVTVHVAC
ncbi:MAG: hypothetical protein ACJ71Z_12455 [Aeromicrobium sp.]